MVEIVVHSVPGSPFGRAVLIGLEEKGVAYRLAPLGAGGSKSPEHLKRHPFGRIPVLEVDGFSLFETQAILRYLDRRYPEPGLTPVDIRAAAKMDQLMNINDWYLFQGVGSVIGFQRVVGPKLLGLPTDEAAIEAAMPKAHTVFAELARQLADKPYFVGSEISLADILLVPHIDFFREMPEWEPLAGPHANLREWLDRMAARPSLERTTWSELARKASLETAAS